MPNLTRDGICYDLKESPYRIDLVYGNRLATYYFSSKLYQSKFQERLEEHRKKINDALSRKFKIEMHLDLHADILLYQNIEKRGFLVFYDERFFRCVEEVKSDGAHLMKKHSQKL